MKKLLRTQMLLAFVFGAGSIVYAQPNFTNPIPIPPLIDVPAGDTIKLELQMLSHQFDPSNPNNDSLNGFSYQVGLQSWAYNYVGDPQYQTIYNTPTMPILGPTLVWHYGQDTKITVKNSLNQPTTTHWHGAEVPAKYDGGPHQPIAVGATWDINFEDRDGTSTMWYHPHYHDNTYPQVQLGLSGMVISKEDNDPIDMTLPGTYGVDDIPIIISDLAIIKEDDLMIGQPVWAVDTNKASRPFNTVNGVSNPYIEVPAHMIRLRILNGSTRKGINFGVADGYSDNNLNDFYLVGTDGGFTMKPDTMKSILAGPGARTEIILDLTGYTVGDVLYLRNLKDDMPYDVIGSPHSNPYWASQPSPIQVGGNDPTTGDSFLEIRIVADPLGYTPVDNIPAFTNTWQPGLQDTLGVDLTRHKNLVGKPNKVANALGEPKTGFTIDSTSMNMMVVNDIVCGDAKEIWVIENKTIVAHPFHIHKIFFRVLDVTDSLGVSLDLDSLGWNGPKDDVLIREGWTVRFLGKFDNYGDPQYTTEVAHDSSYMYHCHILTHEDDQGGGMMHQFVVTTDSICQAIAGIDDVFFEEQKDFLLVPNPAKEELAIHGYAYEPTTIRIVGLNGSISKTQILQPFDGKANIDITGLPKGFYIVEWTTDKGVITKKLMLQ